MLTKETIEKAHALLHKRENLLISISTLRAREARRNEKLSLVWVNRTPDEGTSYHFVVDVVNKDSMIAFLNTQVVSVEVALREMGVSYG